VSTLIYGNDELFANWAASRIPEIAHVGFGNCKTVAVATGTAATDRLLAVIVLHDYDHRHSTCQISIAAQSPLWATRGNIRAILSIPFEQYGCRKVWSVIASTNRRALRLNKGLGFRVEGTLRDQYGRKVHAVVTGMMVKEYVAKWKQPSSAPAIHRNRHAWTPESLVA
jgi:RimJ/RimL family protein N-acetyltransferase